MRHAAVLARAPSAQGKTRLTLGLPDARARSLREALLQDTVQAVTAAGVPCTVYVTPGDAVDEVRALVATDIRLAPQADGDLGHRMASALEAMLNAGAGQAVLLGSDLPSLPPARVSEAFDALAAGTELVLGPAEDGGYYLVGLTRALPELFDGMRWGSAEVLRQTLDAAAARGVRARVIGSWYDVDRPEDLDRVIVSSAPARAVRAWQARR